nr:probable leucine-rich repeat receptor-like protein kinase At5g49770 [Coffea arabica]
MFARIQPYLLVIFIQVLVVAAITNPQDFAALQSLKSGWENAPPNWVGTDPCGSGWDGIGCSNSRVVSITLASVGLSGQVPGDIADLSELLTL